MWEVRTISSSRLKISDHALQRYFLRRCGDKAVAPEVALRWMWHTGRTATDDDLSVFNAKRRCGYNYRVSRAPNGLNYLMIEANDQLVTLWDDSERGVYY